MRNLPTSMLAGFALGPCAAAVAYDVPVSAVATLLCGADETDAEQPAGNGFEPREPAFRLRRDRAGRVTDAVDSDGVSTSRTFDPKTGRVATTTTGATKTEFVYDSAGNLVAVIDPLGGRRTFEVDAYGRVTGESVELDVVNARGVRSGTRTVTATTAYSGKKTTATDFAGFTTVTVRSRARRTFDETVTGPNGYEAVSSRRLSRGGIPLEASRAVTLDGEKFSTTETIAKLDFRGSAGRVERTITFAGRDVKSTESREFYPNGRVRRITRSVDGVAVVTTDYVLDRADRLVEIRQSFVDEPTRWASGRVPEDRSVAFRLDGIGERLSLTRRDATGEVIAETRQSFDDRGRLVQQVHATADGVEIGRVELAYTAAGRVSGRGRSFPAGMDGIAPSQVERFTYDAVGRLASVERRVGPAPDDLGPPRTTDYRYDAAGNRVGADVLIGTQSRLLRDAEAIYGYDDNGRLVSRRATRGGGRVTYRYGHDGRLISAERSGRRRGGLPRSIESAYADDGDLVAVAADGEPYFVIESDAGRELVLDADGRIVRHAMYGPGANEVLAVDAGGVTAWAFADHLGSVGTWGVPPAGRGNWRLRATAFDEFGNVLAEGGDGVPPQVPTVWAGHEFHAAIGLYDAKARPYDPRTGRFVTPKPERSRADFENLYRYVSNDPLNRIDPDGL